MRAKHVGFIAAATAPGSRVGEDREGRRLALLGGLYAASHVVLLGMGYIAAAAGHLEMSRLVPAARPVAAAGILLGVAVLALAPRVPRQPLGIAFEIGGGLIFSLVETLRPWPPAAVTGVPICSLWIVVCALLISLPSRAALVAALAAAATGPLSAGALALAGHSPTSSALQVVYFHVPSFVAAGVAFAGTRALQQARHAARVLGSYRLVKKIGHGGMGEVWRAEHHLLTHPAAVKLVRLDTIATSDRAVILKRFEREAQITANLTSPHTVDLYDYGVSDDGIVYYVMELIEGIDLEMLVERFGPLPPARVVHFLRQACHSLAEAHAAGLIHRDIKPSNLFCCRAGLEHDYLKVLDFGLVRKIAKLGGVALTKQGVVMGTPGFIAPEAALGRQGVDHRSDLYSLGCVGYYLLSAEHVFDLRSPMRALHDHVYGKPIDISRRVPGGVPADLARVVMRCLAKNPAERPPDAEELARLLGAIAPAWEQGQAAGWWKQHGQEAQA